MKKELASLLPLSIRPASVTKLTTRPGTWPDTHFQLKLIKARCSFSEIVGHLEHQYDDILAEESRIKRNPRFRDNRVHALLYFITPTGHGYVGIYR